MKNLIIKAIGTPFAEIFSIFPYPFKRGKITENQVPSAFKNFSCYVFLESNSTAGGCFKLILALILPPVAFVIGSLFVLEGTVKIIYLLMPEFIKNSRFFRGLKWVHVNKTLAADGLQEFNKNHNFEAAKEKFIAAKENFEAGMWNKEAQKQCLIGINEIITECMGYLEQYDELYDFIQNNEVLYKRTKLFLLSCLTKSQEETISYFETNYPEEELKKHPAYLILPLLAIAIFYNDTQKALQYLEDNYSYVYNQWMNDELYVLTAVKIEFYQQLGDTANTNKLKDSLLDYEKTLSTDYVASEFVKAIPILQRNRKNECN